jgi:hypothetical protein
MDVFAVGGGSGGKLDPSYGIILHYDGNTWSTMEGSIGEEFLHNIWGSSSMDVFAVGDRGTILHYNGRIWSFMASGTQSNLNGVWGSSDHDVFAVDNYGILHYDGITWSASMESDRDNWIIGVWGSSSTDVFAVGGWGTIFHYDGSAWSSITNPARGAFNHFYGVWGSSGIDVFAVGHWGNILHYSATDMDHDEIADYADECPESNLETSITIDGCDTDVQNQLFQNGCTMSDIMAECDANSDTRFRFLTCVNQCTRQWKQHGVGLKEKYAILRCAFRTK